MKRLKLHLTLSIFLLVLMSFTAKLTPQQNSFGPWKTSTCFKGLDFCVKKGSYHQPSGTYMWTVKFRNRYNVKIHFNCVLAASNATSANTRERDEISPNEEFENDFFVADANNVRVFVDKMRFGNEDYGEYANCDND